MTLTLEQQLWQAIAKQAPTRVVQAALLVGSYGESGWNPEATSPGAYGAFQFTPPGSYGPGSVVGASPAAQVAAILPSYVEWAARVPAHLTGAAQAEWVALGAERPEYYDRDQATIEQTGTPTTYGANFSYTVQNWAAIEQLLIAYPLGGPQVSQLFIKASKTEIVGKVAIKAGDVFQEVTHKGESWLHGRSANLVATINPDWIVIDTADGGWINAYAGKIIPSA